MEKAAWIDRRTDKWVFMSRNMPQVWIRNNILLLSSYAKSIGTIEYWLIIFNNVKLDGLY